MRNGIVLVLLWPAAAFGDDLPAGAALRLGGTRFRAGAEVAELHFSADGSELISRSPVDDARTRTIHWNPATGQPLAATIETRRPGSRVRWSAATIPDSTRGIAIGDDGVPVVRDFALEKDVVRLIGHFARVSAVAVSPDGRRIATASVDGLIRVWDAATFRPLFEPAGHTAAVKSLEVSPDGRTLLTAAADRTVRIWDLASGRQRRAFSIPDGSHPAFTADGAAVRIPGPTGDEIRDLVTGLQITSPMPRFRESLPLVKFAMRYVGIAAALSPDRRTVAIARHDGTIELWETASCQVRRTLPGHGAPCRDLAFTPDGTRLISASTDHSVLVWPVRIRDVQLAAAVRRETDAGKLWNAMAYGQGPQSYAAMARLAADPPAAAAMARFCLKPGSAANPIADARAVELLEAIGTPQALRLLRDLAEWEEDGPRRREASAALNRLGGLPYRRDGIRTIGGTQP
ncbi:MAG TPA: WD40 repeat domain-containing protein [Urbifossiella sp.]|nr:WD40 repeat domain-containing protein [Urbifossiella sp.]